MEGNIRYIAVLAGVALRYFLFAGTAYLIFYFFRKEARLQKKIQKKFPKTSSIHTELLYSLMTIFIFAAVIYLFLFSPVRRTTRLYNDIHEYSYGWFFASIVLVIFLHDTYFYWTHRLMHWKKIFRFAHHVHHKSHNPTPLAAFSFHPVEAFVEIGIVPLSAYIIPLHPVAFALFGLYMITMNVMGHLGYELFPRSFINNKWLNWYNSSTHHNMHHHYSRSNYGLYFNIWDRLMGTNHKDYREKFLQVTGNKNDADGEPAIKA